ncbi:hypothetical protein Rxycam_02473 [Rubrobacter xylanophilus DSM 9941]|nr:hypothetical protein Rxycam_02473 [Rubrobacter xylanophilus DSM 9941]
MPPLLQGAVGSEGGKIRVEKGGDILLTGDTGTLTMRDPAAWSDVRTGGSLELDSENPEPAMLVSTDARRWIDTFEVPGVYFVASSRLPENTVEQILDLPQVRFPRLPAGTRDGRAARTASSPAPLGPTPYATARTAPSGLRRNAPVPTAWSCRPS